MSKVVPIRIVEDLMSSRAVTSRRLERKDMTIRVRCISVQECNRLTALGYKVIII